MKKTKRNIVIYIGYFLNLAFLSACASHSAKQIPAGTPVLLDTKVQIKSKNEKNNLNIEIVLSPGRAIRMEVTGTLGYRVASILMTPQSIQYALHASKSYYQGPFSARSIYPIFNQYIEPRILWKVIHDQSPQTARLVCQMDTSGRPSACQGEQNLTIKWTYQDPPQKKIELKNNAFELIWLFKERSLFSGSQTETFVLKKPDSYQEIILK